MIAFQEIDEALRLLEASKWPPTTACHPIFHAVAKRLDSRPGCFERQKWPASLFPVECRPSPLHGLGVFTTKDVERGELLTLYPPDGFAMNTHGGARAVRLKCSLPQEEVEDLDRRYSIGLDAGDTFVAMLGCPQLNQDPAYLGHMANDSEHAPDQSRRQQKLAKRQVNAEFCDIASAAHKAVVALKRIPAGTEVLCSYGDGYWRERARRGDA